ncbi:winged helix-turn-helix domain-containing protein [Allokutzneria multivorans]|uniref:Winged helix-turn-helix domain-containing protein n=1 Tax=Allokutzneria multivorans TaxID=1142134 RepID=A0ABP7R9Q5_9PSEU
MTTIDVLKALANERRMQILDWLKDPTRHFPPQVDGDLERDGVCALYIAEKLGMSQPSAGEHLKVLAAADLVIGTRIKQWVFYRRNEERIEEVREALKDL